MKDPIKTGEGRRGWLRATISTTNEGISHELRVRVGMAMCGQQYIEKFQSQSTTWVHELKRGSIVTFERNSTI